MMCDFKVGEEVICIAPEDELEYGKTYIIYAITTASFCTHWHERTGEIAASGSIILNVNCSPAEKEANARGCPDEAGWYHWRFRRPIVQEHFTEERQKAPVG